MIFVLFAWYQALFFLSFCVLILWLLGCMQVPHTCWENCLLGSDSIFKFLKSVVWNCYYCWKTFNIHAFLLHSLSSTCPVLLICLLLPFLWLWTLAISFTCLLLLCFYISICQLLSSSVRSYSTCPKNFSSDWLLYLVLWLSFQNPSISSEGITFFYTLLHSVFTEACSCQSYFRFLFWRL